ncbi:MAG: hypothetical protein SV062_02015 [Thermodesulfobacteriota bacterium]|nr:hypothetical protein [Thermodesulfobacteriota bacterium]
MTRFKTVHYKNLVLTVFLLFIASALSDCAFLRVHDKYFNNKPVIEKIIKPHVKPLKVNSIGIFNFNHSTKINDIGYNFSEKIHKRLLKYHFVNQLILTGIDSISEIDSVNIGKRKDYDLILLGCIDELSYGGLTDCSKVDISLKIIDVRTNIILCYIRGHIDRGYEKSFDKIFLKKESKESPSPYKLADVVLDGLVDTLIKDYFSWELTKE